MGKHKKISESIFVKLNKVDKKLQDLSKYIYDKNTNRKTAYLDKLFVPIILSLISACVFWAVFNYIPEHNRRIKVEPKIKQELYEIISSIENLMNSIMRHDNNQNRIYSRKIISGKLTKEDIELGLQNKCIDSSCLNDANINNYMEIVGDNMRSAKIDIMSNINELYYFMEFLNSEEIIILETIKKILVQLPEMDGRHSNPFYPNLASHADEIFLLYNSYCRLLPCIFDDNSSTIRTNKYIDIGFPIAEINYHLYFSNNYKKCIKTIEQVNKEIPSFFPVPEDFFTLQFIESHYKQGNRNIAFKTFKGYYIKQEENIRTKMYIIDLFHKYDKRIINWSKEKMNEDEKYLLSLSLDKMNLNDINKLNDFKKNNNYLKEYFDNRNNESK